MSQYLDIFFKGQPMGVVAWDQQRQEGKFEFYRTFSDQLAVVSPILLKSLASKKDQLVWPMPLLRGKPDTIPPFFRDCLPGDYAIMLLRQALKDAPKTPEALSPLALFSLLGQRGKGAFRFEPHGYPELDHAEPVDISRLVKYAQRVYQEDGKGLSENRLRELLRCGLFTTGSWPEALLAINDYTGEVRSGQAEIPTGFEAWTLKLDGVIPGENGALVKEFDYFRKAGICGLDVVPCRQLKEGNHIHLLKKRIDRNKQANRHVQSFSALMDQTVDSGENVFRCMRLLHLAYPEMVNFYKRIAFTVLTGNNPESGDDLFFYCNELEEWHLAPADGLFCPSRKGSKPISINGKTGHPGIEDVIELGTSQGIRKAAAIVSDIQSLLTTAT